MFRYILSFPIIFISNVHFQKYVVLHLLDISSSDGKRMYTYMVNITKRLAWEVR